MSKKGTEQMVLIYYGKDTALKEKINTVLDRMHVNYIELGQNDLSKKLKDLVQKEEHALDLEGNSQIFMYFYDEKVDTITKIDNALKEEGIFVRHKAVTTPTNLEWTLQELISHIEAEASYFQKREKLRSLVSNPDLVKFSQYPKYRNLMSMCYELLEENDVPEKMLDTAIALIEHYPEA